ncbi:DUF3558 domain-containing protein [Amycolatopsis thermoflava]|uniref:DUF3558 domain-containing protein n=1 Tax=Amycolatopsis thermoflava TaxID=84480 RepID=UPI000F4C769C|nr:DUF3558 domain-containing protein [Amycolatopsis thermoflava]
MVREVKISVTATIGAALLVLTSCSDSGGSGIGTSFSPTSPGRPTQPTSTATADQAPPVPTPLDATAFIADPCNSLTSAQTAELTISNEGRHTENACSWKFGPNLEWVVQAFYTVNDKGLQNTYDQNAAGWFKNGYFEPTSVSGYPAVYSNVTDARPQGTCDLVVGLDDRTILDVSVTGKPGEDNCGAASTVAGKIIETIGS